VCGALVDTEPLAETLPPFAPDFVTVFGEVVFVALWAGAIVSPIPKNMPATFRGIIMLPQSAGFARTFNPQIIEPES
jgi:hypothetical protein